MCVEFAFRLLIRELFNSPAPPPITAQSSTELAMQPMRLYNPSLLRDPPRRPDGLRYLPLESPYQAELYLAAASQGIALSTEFGKLGSKESGVIDFFLSAKKWGFELLMNGKEISRDSKIPFLD